MAKWEGPVPTEPHPTRSFALPAPGFRVWPLNRPPMVISRKDESQEQRVSTIVKLVSAYVGFTMGNSPRRISPEGVTRSGENRFRPPGSARGVESIQYTKSRSRSPADLGEGFLPTCPNRQKRPFNARRSYGRSDVKDACSIPLIVTDSDGLIRSTAIIAVLILNDLDIPRLCLEAMAADC
jgi:hypothetical protein